MTVCSLIAGRSLFFIKQTKGRPESLPFAVKRMPCVAVQYFILMNFTPCDGMK